MRSHLSPKMQQQMQKSLCPQVLVYISVHPLYVIFKRTKHGSYFSLLFIGCSIQNHQLSTTGCGNSFFPPLLRSYVVDGGRNCCRTLYFSKTHFKFPVQLKRKWSYNVIFESDHFDKIGHSKTYCKILGSTSEI